MTVQIRKQTIHGVEVSQTQLQGKWYTPVDGRVKIAEHADPTLIRREGAGYHVVSVEILQMDGRWAYHCMVEYPVGSGVVKPGTDFIDTKDNAGIAKAETSAIGRALGLHGIACEESIASAEEMERVTDSPVEHATPIQRAFVAAPKPLAPAPAAPAAAADDDEPATKEQQERLRKYREALGIEDKSIAVADNLLRRSAAEARISTYIAKYQKSKQSQPATTAGNGARHE
jgi:hypothetical protein